MKHLASPAFSSTYHALPKDVRALADKDFALLKADRAHPSLHFKKLVAHVSLWSVRVTLSVRAVGHREGETITWVWIGSHAEFDRRFG